ncbi:MAG TPA: amidohydrolase family protein [Xanthobacteraceae bacterium]|nr:amidohydrolase family protein [Xanthobacteraceae bacterium]
MTSDNGKRRGFSRRRFIQGAAAAAAASGSMLSSAAREEKHEEKHGDRPRPPSNDAPDIVLVNGKIHTMDDEGRVASAVSIRDGRFVEVGHAARGLHGHNTKVIDLRGRTVVPGIIDNHNHIVLMGNRPGYHTPLENAYSIPDVQAIYAARAAGIPRDAWITTIGGFHSNHIYANPSDPLSGRLPTRAELDIAVPNNPVFIEIGFTGPATTNSAGKSIFESQGITVAENGSMTGNNPSRALLYLRQALLTPESRRRAVIDAMNYAVTVGVTTHLDQGAFQATNTAADGAAHEDNFTMHIPFLEVYDQGKGIVRLRINFLHMESDQATPELVQRLKNAFQFLGNDMVKTGSIGEFIAAGTSATSPFVAAAKRVAAAGWRAEVHSLGRRNTPTSNPADFELEIMGFEAANNDFPGVVRERRWVIAHVPGITQEWIDRLQAIGGNLSLTGWQYLAGNPTASTVAPYAGPPFRMIVDSGKRPGGIHAGMSSDGMQIAPMNPWLHMYYATTGINARKVLINPGQQISREEVLSLYTRENGWFLREEDQLGTIESGKLADLVVLNSDYFAVPNEDLKKIRSVLTVVGGNVVYDGGVLDLRG